MNQTIYYTEDDENIRELVIYALKSVASRLLDLKMQKIFSGGCTVSSRI